MTIHHVDAGVLRVAFEQHGPLDGPAVVLLHGFPYDVRAFDAVVPPLVAAGCRVVVPWLRGYGPTRFLSPDTPRSGQQAALALDLLALLEALDIPGPCWPATTGAAVRPASSRPCGRSAWPAWSPVAATTCTTCPAR